MPSTSHYILATAGHVDHGKSALVRALTGTDPDRLPEEKARGITIDLGFAHLDLASPPSVQPPARYHLGIVDVPGHEDFVKNMVAGVGSIDLALLIVAADDGWMPQTEEHLQILLYLGVSRAVVALTKVDLVADDGPLRAQVREKLAGTPLAGAALVGTSVVDNRGIDELKVAFAEVLKDLPPPRDIGKPRLPVDRAFVMKGAGTVVTGTLTGGSLKKGQAVVVRPSGKASRVRVIQSHNREADSIGPGSRVALNLPDVSVDADGRGGAGAAVVARGDVVTLADLGAPSDTIDVLVQRSDRLRPEEGGAARPVKDGTLVRMHLGSGDFPGRLYLLGTGELLAGQRSVGQLRFESPVFAFAGDRFILRDWPEQHTLAGGIVLDPDATRQGFRTQQRRDALQQRADAPDRVAPYLLSQLAREGALRRSGTLPKSRFSAAEIDAAVNQVVAEGKAVAVGDVIAEAGWWQALRKAATDVVDAEHRDRPEQIGPRLGDLRGAVEKQSKGTQVFDALVADLCRSGFVRTGDRIKRAAHRPALPPRLQAAGARIRTALAAKPFDPPSRKELAPDVTSQQALRFLIETGEAADLGPDAVLSAEGYAKATEAIRGHLRQRGAAGATVSELKPVLGVSRRIMVPLLEKLDRDGVTVRRGDVRVLRAPG